MQPTPTTDYQLLSSWLTVIGMLTMDWSPVERHIDQCVHFLHGKLTLSKKQKKKPTRLGSKLEFIKCNMPPEIFDQNGFECLVNMTKGTVQIRDVCVHGVLNSYDHSKIEIGKIDGTKDGHHIENFTIDLDRLKKSAEALSVLQEQWGSIASALYEHTKMANQAVERDCAKARSPLLLFTPP